jgi:hypothetical protein
MTGQSDPIPWITWLSGGAAVLVLLATAAILLSPPESPRGATDSTSRTASDTPAGSVATASAEAAKSDAAQAHPLDISAVLMDARARAALFSERSALVGARLIIDEGKPLGPIEISYAVAKDRPLPGDPVTSKRLRISYLGATITPTPETSPTPARVLPDPNCPLEAAFRAAVQSGAPDGVRYFAVYAHSTRYQRPTWTLTAADGKAHHVDAGNCALIVR